MKILVTGGAGYIGSVLVRQLLSDGHDVHVIDVLRSGGESILDLLSTDRFTFSPVDVRDKASVRQVMTDKDAVVHLAAIVGDPACGREPDLARSINLDASKQLYELAEQAGVSRFVFASTCSNYGKMEGETFLDEEAPLRPVSLYAKTKVAVEQHLLSRPEENTCNPHACAFPPSTGSPRGCDSI